MRIIALSGSPASLPALQLLHREGLLSAIICPLPAVGIETEPIEAWAKGQGIPCWQTDSQSLDIELSELIRETTIDLLLVYGFPCKVSNHLLQQVKYGGWNVHFSLHPQNKGSITIHQLADHAGQNKVLQQCDVNLLPIENAGTPIRQLSLLSVGLLQAALNQVTVQATPN